MTVSDMAAVWTQTGQWAWIPQNPTPASFAFGSSQNGLPKVNVKAKTSSHLSGQKSRSVSPACSVCCVKALSAMNKTKWINTQEKGPVSKTKVGRFEVSVWKWTKYISQSEAVKDLFAERVVQVDRACVRYSKWDWKTQSWEAHSIWCSVDELRDLVNALDALNFRDNP